MMFGNYICSTDIKHTKEINILAENLREKGLNIAVDLSGKKLGDQLKTASKKGVPFVICVGEDEIKSGLYGVKNMETGDETKVKAEEIPGAIKK